MLILSRYRGEEIVIGSGVNQIVVGVMEIRGDKVQLGVMAPKVVPVHRREVYEAIVRDHGTVTSGAKQKGPGGGGQEGTVNRDAPAEREKRLREHPGPCAERSG